MSKKEWEKGIEEKIDFIFTREKEREDEEERKRIRMAMNPGLAYEKGRGVREAKSEGREELAEEIREWLKKLSEKQFNASIEEFPFYGNVRITGAQLLHFIVGKFHYEHKELTEKEERRKFILKQGYQPKPIEGIQGSDQCEPPVGKSGIAAIPVEKDPVRKKTKRGKPYLCPICKGDGKCFNHQTSGQWTNTGGTEECKSCQGTGILWSDEEGYLKFVDKNDEKAKTIFVLVHRGSDSIYQLGTNCSIIAFDEPYRAEAYIKSRHLNEVKLKPFKIHNYYYEVPGLAHIKLAERARIIGKIKRWIDSHKHTTYILTTGTLKSFLDKLQKGE